ncbi:MAG TPA: S53 family peptidase [Streptosporangiaceae bacterium]|nr:S53 family peptidase [Streptosporangiaceae bacterium]
MTALAAALTMQIAGMQNASTVPVPPSATTPRFIPGALHVGKARASAPDVAQCQQQNQLPCYDPAQIDQAYSLTGGNSAGSGVTIAIVDTYGSPTIASDLATFDSQFGLAALKLSIIRPAGPVPKFNSQSADMVSWAGETTLDVEWAHAIAPGAAILLVETPTDDGDAGYAEAEDYVIQHRLADVISQSWGVTEEADSLSDPGIQALHQAYVAAQQAGITVLAAAGDNGATDPTSNPSELFTRPAAEYPATDPLVTAVGGTELHLNDNGSRISPDTVWNDTWNAAANQYQGSGTPSATAGGGGRSTWFARPSYQDSVQQTVGAMRGIPDIAMNAACSSPVLTYQSYAGQQAGWYSSCGTSESTPLMAGIVALADQAAGHSLGFINPALYELAADHAAGIVLVTSGSNTVTFKQGGRTYTISGYTARDGYSRAAGVGTVDGQYLIPELARLA